MDREALCESLILWVQTFNLDVAHTSAEDLSDGIAMSRLLHQIAPDYFTDSWTAKIKTEDVTNWRLKVSNLKKILKGILEYNLEVLGIQIHDFQMPDVNAIGEHNDRGELGRLLQLILGCAVNCSEKQEYIQRIMAMEESVQHVVMTAIQELMTKEIATDVDSEVGEQLKRTMDELNTAIEAKEELMQRCHELDLQVAGLLEEKQNLAIENERLSERLNQAENLDDPSTPAGKRFQQIQHQLDQCQEDNYKLESAKDDYRIKVEVLQKEVNDLKEKNTDLNSMADECRGLKDELDVLKHTAEQVVKYEAQIESYKKKMDELSDLRGQVKLLEEKNTKYMQENLDIQEEVRKSGTVKQQLDVYKRQVHELQSKLTEETKRADKAEFEAKRMIEKVATLNREKERIVTERDSLREVNEELKCTQLQHVGASSGEDLNTTTNIEMLSLPPEIKEKMLRLEHENKMLKLKSSGDSDEQSQVIQTMLDDANSRKNELETELRLANQKTMELEAQVEDLQEMAKSTVASSELVDLKRKLAEQVQATQQRDNVIEQERASVAELQSQLSQRAEEVEKLRDEIEKKEEEKRVMGDRYKKYFDKARAVITSQEQKLKSSGNHYPDVQALRQQIQEKDRYIEQLLKEQEKSKTTFEQEEKMMVSAWYNLGIQLHRQAAIDRLENSQGQAFLSRQRQVHLRGQQRIPNSHPNPSSSHAYDLDLPIPTTNQSVARGDGCFSSLFDCLLARVQDELKTEVIIDNVTSSQEESAVKASAVHSHLLAGLLGQDIEKLKQVEKHLRSVDKISNKPIEAEDDTTDSDKDKQATSVTDENVQLIKQFYANAIQESLAADADIDEKVPLIKQQKSASTKVCYTKIVPETPTRKETIVLKDTPSLDCSFMEDQPTDSDKNDSMSSSEELVLTGKPNTSLTSKEDGDLRLNSSSPLLDLSTQDSSGAQSLNSTCKSSFSSFFDKLDDYEVSYFADGLDDLQVSRSSTCAGLPAHVDDLEVCEPVIQANVCNVEACEAVIGENVDNLESCKPLIGYTSGLLDVSLMPASPSGPRFTDGKTPLKTRAYSNVESTQEASASPFIKNFSSERVTKRRARRKRKHQSPDREKENTSADDSLLLKQFCEGTGQM